MYPVPAISDLSNYSGRPEASYTSYADAALLQSTITFTYRTELFDGSQLSNPDDQSLALTGICAYADVLYLRFPYQAAIASPMDTETIGSYSYNKGQSAIARQYQGIELTMETTGVALFDLAVQFLALRTQTGGVYHDGVSVFEVSRSRGTDQAAVFIDDLSGRRFILGPSEMRQLDVPFDVNAQEFPHDPGI